MSLNTFRATKHSETGAQFEALWPPKQKLEVLTIQRAQNQISKAFISRDIEYKSKKLDRVQKTVFNDPGRLGKS